MGLKLNPKPHLCVLKDVLLLLFQFNRANIFDDDNQRNSEQFVFRAKVDT